MGLLKALFAKKSKVGAAPGVAAVTKDVQNVTLNDTRGDQGATSVPVAPIAAPSPWPTAAAPDIAAQEPALDIRAASMEPVDYTQDEGDACEAPPAGAGEAAAPEAAPAATAADSNSAETGPISADAEPASGEEHNGEEQQEEDASDGAAVGGSENESGSASGRLSAEALAPLNSMVYLTEDAEAAADTISVVSDGLGGGGAGGDAASDIANMADLTQALETLETLEAEVPGSPLSRGGSEATGAAAAAAVVAAATGTPPPTASGPAPPLGSSPSGSLSSFGGAGGPGAGVPAHFSKNMVKLYNDLALRLMEGREYEQALALLRKAEALLDNDAAWSAGEGSASSTAARLTSGSLGGSFRMDSIGPGFSFNAGSIDESGAPGSPQFGGSSLGVGVGSPSPAAGSLAEAIQARIQAKRDHLRAITYNNLGCLFKRRNLPEEALPYLHNALALEEAGGSVHDCASTHLNLCASYSALTRFREALAHAERAIILLQRQLWGAAGAASFQEGMAVLGRAAASLAAAVAAGPGDGNAPATAAAFAEAHRSQRRLLASASILAMAYHNAAVEHERLNRLREAAVSYSRACMIGQRILGPKSSTTVALVHAQKAFQARQAREAAGGGGEGGGGGGGHHHGGAVAAGGARKAPSTLGARSGSAAALGGKSRTTGPTASKRGVGSTTSRTTTSGSRSTSKSSLSSKLTSRR